MKIGTVRQNESDIDINCYDGIDIHLAKNHPNDGSGGFLLFFISTDQFYSYNKECKREQIVDNLLGKCEFDDDYYDIKNIDNNYIGIYHCNYGNNERLEIAEQLFNRSMDAFSVAKSFDITNMLVKTGTIDNSSFRI